MTTEAEAPRKIWAKPEGDYPELLDILKKIQKERGRPLFVFFVEFIDFEICDQVHSWRRELKGAAKDGNLDVLIHSPGGSLSDAYIVARALGRCSNCWEALVPDLAASGATLICLGASKIVMSEGAVLSPLDPLVTSKRREKFSETERQSPLEAFQALREMRRFALTSLDTMMHFFLNERKVTPRLALEAAGKLAVQMLEPIISKIDPYDVGAFSLDSKVAIEYCKRVSDPLDKNKKSQRGVNPKALVEDYPAHEFVIDIEEARALGFNVSDPEPAVDVLFDELQPYLDFKKPTNYIGLVA
jgi:hypothetical protein